MTTAIGVAGIAASIALLLAERFVDAQLAATIAILAALLPHIWAMGGRPAGLSDFADGDQRWRALSRAIGAVALFLLLTYLIKSWPLATGAPIVAQRTEFQVIYVLVFAIGMTWPRAHRLLFGPPAVLRD